MSKFLTTKELCERWNIADNTLRKWRVAGYGPTYVKLGTGRLAQVRYLLDDIIAFETANRIEPGND